MREAPAQVEEEELSKFMHTVEVCAVVQGNEHAPVTLDLINTHRAKNKLVGVGAAGGWWKSVRVRPQTPLDKTGCLVQQFDRLASTGKSIKNLFQIIDRDGSGAIGPPEMDRALKAMVCAAMDVGCTQCLPHSVP